MKIFFFAIIFLLSACGSEDYENDAEYEPEILIGSLYDAIAAGILMDASEVGRIGAAVAPRIQVAELADVSADHTRNLTFVVNFSRFEVLEFLQDDRYFGEFFVTNWQFVNEGDLIASATTAPTELFLAQFRRAQNNLRRAEEDFASERDRRQIEIEDTRDALEIAGAAEWERLAINLRILELEYEQFVTATRNALEIQRERLAELEKQTQTEYIVAPFDGLITRLTGIREGTEITKGREIAEITCVDSMFFSTWYSNMHQFRYGDVFLASIYFPDSEPGDEPFEFEMRVISDPFAAGHREQAEVVFGGAGPWDPIQRWQPQAQFILAPVVPEITQTIISKYGYDFSQMIDHTARRRVHPTWNMYGEGIWIHHRAILHTPNDELPFVYIYEDGAFGRRFITVGPYVFGNYVNVLSGIEPGWKVVLH